MMSNIDFYDITCVRWEPNHQPFLPASSVDLMANYSEQASKLTDMHGNGMRMKYYYTVRELSTHAAETFPLLSLQGEVIDDTDPMTIPQVRVC